MTELKLYEEYPFELPFSSTDMCRHQPEYNGRVCSRHWNHDGQHANVGYSGLIQALWDHPVISEEEKKLRRQLNGLADQVRRDLSCATHELKQLRKKISELPEVTDDFIDAVKATENSLDDMEDNLYDMGIEEDE